MSSFAPQAGTPADHLGSALRSAFGVPADGDLEAVLETRQLALVCGLAMLGGAFYTVYFLSTGLLAALPVGLAALGVGGAALAFARVTGRRGRAIDVVNVLLFAMFAAASMLQDGIRSPALWWLAAPPIIALLAGRLWLGAALCALFAAQASLLRLHGPGSWGSLSLLADDASLQATLAMTLSAVCVGLFAGLSVHWSRQGRRALELARAAAIAATEAKARFIASISHELRTPLQGMLGAGAMLRDPRLAVERRDGLIEVQQQGADMLLALVNDVLDLSRLDAGKIALEQRPVRLFDLVAQVRSFFAPQAEAKGIALTCRASSDTPELLLGDPTRIRQIVANLVANALKFTLQGGVEIRVGLDAPAPAVAAVSGEAACIRIEVADTGIGIGAAALATLFKPFVQADATIAPRFGGTGLGLSIADELARLMQGRIEVASQAGRGSVFALVLPLQVADASRIAAPCEVGRSAWPVALHVLVVEDDAASRAVVGAMLEVLGVRWTAASNGREALARLAALHPDAVLMDLQMPDLDGLAATRALREAESALGGTRRTAVIAMTGSTESETVLACLKAGMDEILTKPFTLEQLQRALTEIGLAARPSAQPV